jgi:stage II sporulation protein D
MKYILYTVFAALILSGCTRAVTSYIRGERVSKQPLRLLLAKNSTSLNIVINSHFKINGSKDSSSEAKGFKAEVESKNIVIDGKAYGPKVKITPGNNLFHLNGNEFRGNLVLYVDNGKLCAVEDFTMEEYLYGVVGREMSGSSPIEALKAQAVAARTFGYYEAGLRHTKDYDIDNIRQSQAYIGTESENPNSIYAVNLTAGEVIKYKGDIIFAAFAANCGGYTEDNSEVFGNKLPYLQAIPCTFCKKYPNSTWQEEIETDHIVSSLRKKGFDIKSISTIYITDTSKAGRVKSIDIITDKGRISMTTNEFRLAIGSDKFKSARFSVRSKGATLQFTGRGWGHGVGLCQDGADGMAKAGASYRRILTRYYTGIELGQK